MDSGVIFYIIAAVAENNVIGLDGKLPWRLKTDLQRFKDLTLDKTVIMGRRTYESLDSNSRPLPRRRNIVVTSRSDYQAPGAVIVHSWEEAIAAGKKAGLPVFVAGGAQIFQLALPLTKIIHLTRVHFAPQGNVYFPKIDWSEWKQSFSEYHLYSPENEHNFSFELWRRRNEQDQ